MQRIKFMIQLFLKGPLWFRLVISISFLASIIFSSSYFSNTSFYESISKLAAAIFFSAVGMKLRMNRVVSILLFTAAAICIYLSIHSLY
ncbi:hypothetical protein [Bacillus sp. 7884-1]|uniref:hypothetical protein n=1 Tax=Bacillus sp. 7884-1 TaxID=2021693 RepID=UPI000BA53FB9|nr:hypothetical protein [Bacillus sp. 7884-1]PAE44695.1 hypothetical protein CHI06_00275 [Bacillus sp. 7884-1]